jgi:hypothetical protein
MSETNYKLGDSVIGHIAKSLQMALLTGTDIVDNLRLMELTVHDGELVLTPECTEVFNENIGQMLSEAQQNQSTSNE